MISEKFMLINLLLLDMNLIYSEGGVGGGEQQRTETNAMLDNEE